jgi:predicted alpha/beta superfamily hydrolase
MNKLNIKLLSLFLVLIFTQFIRPQRELTSNEVRDFSLYNTKAEYIKSEIVADSFFILISVPDSYSSDNNRYPVLYVLDGDIAYGIATSISRYLQIGDNIPELIVVGIGYGSLTKKVVEKRSRDFKPEESGGAENFLKFLDEELIPYIDSNYRTIPGDRTINGYSLGGLFSLYTLFTRPESFNRYVIGSPNMSWDDYSIFNYEENSPKKISDKQLNIFISIGSEESEERYFNPVDSLVTRIQNRNYPGVIFETNVFNGSTHLEGPPESLTHGLISVFEK